jgi:uncharacterized membrane protein YkvA (DUF1232 family)
MAKAEIGLGCLNRAKTWARSIKRDIVAIWLAGRDCRTPLTGRILAFCVAAYALSPVDLIPDFIPILGYLDDLLIVPVGIIFVIWLVPGELMAEFRRDAAQILSRPISWAGLRAIAAIWLLVLSFAILLLTDLL